MWPFLVHWMVPSGGCRSNTSLLMQKKSRREAYSQFQRSPPNALRSFENSAKRPRRHSVRRNSVTHRAAAYLASGPQVRLVHAGLVVDHMLHEIKSRLPAIENCLPLLRLKRGPHGGQV